MARGPRQARVPRMRMRRRARLRRRIERWQAVQRPYRRAWPYLLLAVLAAPAVFLALPESLQTRFETIVNPEVGPKEAERSGEGRIQGPLVTLGENDVRWEYERRRRLASAPTGWQGHALPWFGLVLLDPGHVPE